MAAAAKEVWQYADPENHDLKVALAEHHSVEPANIVIGEGIEFFIERREKKDLFLILEQYDETVYSRLR